MAFAFILDSVGAGEWFVLLAVLLVVMGPKRLPSTARTIGSYYSKFRRAAENFKRQLMDMDYEMERELEKARREAESAISIPDDPPPSYDDPDMPDAPEYAVSQDVPDQAQSDAPAAVDAEIAEEAAAADGDKPHKES